LIATTNGKGEKEVTVTWGKEDTPGQAVIEQPDSSRIAQKIKTQDEGKMKMKSRLTRMIATAALGLTLAAPGIAGAAETEASASVGVYSHYVWRG